MAELTEGWCLLQNSWKAHYFRDGWSLCGIRYTPKYLAADGEYRDSDCCIECRRKRAEIIAAPATQAALPFAEDTANN